MHHKFVVFPFSAIVGQDLMKKALLVNAIDPTIGGVLIKGDKGTGKSTAVRALADLLPTIRVVKDCPFNCDPDNIKLMCKSCQEEFEKIGELSWIEKKMEVIDMPLSATEDMVVGTIDIKKALKEGIKALQPGILAKANRNILYIDEVNLLNDHLISILLDSAAMGVNIVEREGISLYHPSRFVLVGTMNPEEGELRPQISDRFGLCVEVKALTSKEERIKVVEYRRLFDLDPWEFEKQFEEEQRNLRNHIINAKNKIKDIKLSKELLEKIVEITTSLEIKTHRADIVMEKTSKALAALNGRDYVNEEDIKEAAILALPHRMRESPFDKPSVLTEQTIQEILNSIPNKTDEKEDNNFDKNSNLKKNIFDLKRFKTDALCLSYNDFPKTEQSQKGFYIRAKESDNPKSIAIDATIRKAVKETGKLEILPEHLMEKLRISTGKVLYIILLDCSSSMKMDKKIRFAKTFAWQVLKHSYEKKSEVALLAFKDKDVEVLVNPTKDVAKIQKSLEEIKTGGRTPLTLAIYKAIELAKKQKDSFCVVVLISDGRCNVFMKGELKEDLKFLKNYSEDVNFIIINTENKYKSVGVLEEIATTFKSSHFYLENLI